MKERNRAGAPSCAGAAPLDLLKATSLTFPDRNRLPGLQIAVLTLLA